MRTTAARDGSGGLSIQVLQEFYFAATSKLGMTCEEAKQVLADLAGWVIHRPGHGDLLRAAHFRAGMP